MSQWASFCVDSRYLETSASSWKSKGSYTKGCLIKKGNRESRVINPKKV